MKNKIVIIGSINMDYIVYVDKFPAPGETIYGKSRFIQPGGKGANQAVAISNSNLVDTHFIAGIGNDNDGHQINEILINKGIIPHFKKCDCSTGNATILVDSHSENSITIIAGANAELMPEDIDVSILKGAKYIVLQNEIPAKTNEFVLKLAKNEDIKVIYNPAPFREIEPTLFKYIDILIVNEIELAQYAQKQDINEAVVNLLSSGVKSVLVTLGKEGSIFVNDKEKISVEAFKVKAIDTVAAGDTYVGYLAASLASGYTMKDAMIFANKASSITVSRKGSIVSIPKGEEVYEK